MGIFRRSREPGLSIAGFLRNEELFRGARPADDVPRRFSKTTRLPDTAAQAEGMVFRARTGLESWQQPLDQMRGSMAEMQALGLGLFSDFGPGGEDYVNRARARAQARAAAGDSQAADTLFRYGGPAPQRGSSPAVKAPIAPTRSAGQAFKPSMAMRQAPVDFAPPMRQPKVPTTRELLDQAAARLKPGVMFTDFVAKDFAPPKQKGVWGKSSASPDFIVSPKGEATPVEQRSTHTNNARSNGTKPSTKLRTSNAMKPCVERPEGDAGGPGKWRGAWFNWCTE